MAIEIEFTEFKDWEEEKQGYISMSTAIATDGFEIWARIQGSAAYGEWNITVFCGQDCIVPYTTAVKTLNEAVQVANRRTRDWIREQNRRDEAREERVAQMKRAMHDFLYPNYRRS